jgi:hypothetical protein
VASLIRPSPGRHNRSGGRTPGSVFCHTQQGIGHPFADPCASLFVRRFPPRVRRPWRDFVGGGAQRTRPVRLVHTASEDGPTLDVR